MDGVSAGVWLMRLGHKRHAAFFLLFLRSSTLEQGSYQIPQPPQVQQGTSAPSERPRSVGEALRRASQEHTNQPISVVTRQLLAFFFFLFSTTASWLRLRNPIGKASLLHKPSREAREQSVSWGLRMELLLSYSRPPGSLSGSALPWILGCPAWIALSVSFYKSLSL